MGRRKRRRWTTRNIIATAIGVFLAAILILSLVPSFTSGSSDVADPDDFPANNDDIVELTQAPNQRSFPPPDPAVSSDRVAIQTTGLFQVPVPGDDWAEFAGRNNSGNDYDPNRQRAYIILNSSERLAIAQAYVELGINYEDIQSLSDSYLSDDYFSQEWSDEYEKAEVTDRTIGDSLLTIDFDLRDEGLSYFGRQISWQENSNLYNLRFVVPVNNPDLLSNLQSLFIENFVFYPNITDTPLSGWTAFSDQEFGIMFKAPDVWERISGNSGRVSVYESADSSDGLQVTVRQIDEEVNIDDGEAVTEWMLNFRDGINVNEGQLVEQRFGNGYLYSYTYPNTDGDTVSGALALFPAHDGGTILVELRLENADTNLLDEEENPIARQILESVTLLAPEGFADTE